MEGREKERERKCQKGMVQRDRDSERAIRAWFIALLDNSGDPIYLTNWSHSVLILTATTEEFRLSGLNLSHLWLMIPDMKH